MVGLEGGEFVLHPEADQILGWFDRNHPNYTLLSNGLAVDKVVAAVKQHHPKHLYVSLDGTRETYLHMRGRDGYATALAVVTARSTGSRGPAGRRVDRAVVAAPILVTQESR